MRILDKNTDFYDYVQDIYPDDTFTFDRRSSYVMARYDMCRLFDGQHAYKIRKSKKPEDTKYYNYLLMQVGCMYWLFLAELTEVSTYGNVNSYLLRLIGKWSDYNKPKKIIDLSVIDISHEYLYFDAINPESRLDHLKEMISINDYKVLEHLRPRRIRKGACWTKSTEEIREYPILKETGIPALVNPEDVYFALDEYFSLEKTASESTVAEGTTNKDKIVNHGFDAKTSFRGKL